MTSVRLRPTFIAGKTYPVWKFNKCVEVDGAILNAAWKIHDESISREFSSRLNHPSNEMRIARIEASLEKAGLLLSWVQFDNL